MVFIHIGTHKTGTTSIQAAMESLRYKLEDKGYCYPLSGSVESDQSIGAKHGHHKLAWSVRESNSTKVYRELEKEMGKESCQHTVISSEELCRLSEAEVRTFLDHFIGNNVTVILYLRNPVDMVTSLYKHNINISKYKSSIERFTKRNLHRVKYIDIIEKWKSHNVVDDLRIVLFDRVKVEEGVVRSFVEEIDAPVNGILNKVIGRLNVSASDSMVLVARLLNRIIDANPKKDKLRWLLTAIKRRALNSNMSNSIVQNVLRFLNGWSMDKKVVKDILKKGIRDRHDKLLNDYLSAGDKKYLEV